MLMLKCEAMLVSYVRLRWLDDRNINLVAPYAALINCERNDVTLAQNWIAGMLTRESEMHEPNDAIPMW